MKTNCKHSPTPKEEYIITKAINSVVEDTRDFIGALRENVIRVIGGYSTTDIFTEYDKKIELLQNEMLTLIKENAELGAVIENLDDAYKRISGGSNQLKKVKIRLV